MQRTRLTAERAVAQKLFANKARYAAVEAKTGVPWYWIACVHWRESDADFKTQLAQGDPLGRESTHIPAGLGPYFDHPGNPAWERAAIEGLEHDGINKIIDWRLEKLLYYWEKWNGWGYFNHGVPSAYVWAGSSIQRSGRYAGDGNWKPNELDTQLGCAPLLKCLMELDNTIKPLRETPMAKATEDTETAVEQPEQIPPAPADQPEATMPQLDPALLIGAFNLAATFFPQLKPFAGLANMAAPIVAKLVDDWPKINQAAPETGDRLLQLLSAAAQHFGQKS